MKEKYLGLKIIGADETGVGDYMTPLVAAAVYVPLQNVDKLVELGVTDSKKMTDKNILKVFNEIKGLIKSSVRHLTQKGYNTLNKSFNAHELKTLIHLNAISSVEKRIDNGVDLIILDQYVNKNSFEKYKEKLSNSSIKPEFPKAIIKLVEKGEMEHISVAAASIVARAYFLNMMQEQEKKWGMKFLLGTNDKVVQVAKDFVDKHGRDNLKEVAKLSFKTTEKV
ncbi:MAG: ribonuclease HIII [Mycoplasma sp.]|nr:ribonuclease HIII [Mycoplasma sp.]